MLKLIKMDLKLIFNYKYRLSKVLFGIFLLYLVTMSVDLMSTMLLFVPIMLVLASSFEFDGKESVLKYYSLIQSLPINRWEYVISKYFSIIIKHIILMAYFIIMFKFLEFLGFNGSYFLDIIRMREFTIACLLSYLVGIPIMFIFFGTGRLFSVYFIGQRITYIFNNFEGSGTFSYIFENADNMKSVYMIILTGLVSILISIFSYKRRDFK